MKPFRIFTHAACEPPGYIGELLDKLGFDYDHVCLFDDKQVPMQLDDVSALVFMGGPGNVNEPTSWMKQEFDLIRQANTANIPMLGICLGAQLMSVSLGGRVWESNTVEVGWHQVTLLDSAKSYPYFESIPESFTVFQWHAHIFSPPLQAVEVATSECSPCQAYILGPHLALQFHLEMSSDVIEALTDKYAEDLVGDSSCVQNREQIMRDIDNQCAATFKLADQMLTPWFQGIANGSKKPYKTYSHETV